MGTARSLSSGRWHPTAQWPTCLLAKQVRQCCFRSSFFTIAHLCEGHLVYWYHIRFACGRPWDKFRAGPHYLMQTGNYMRLNAVQWHMVLWWLLAIMRLTIVRLRGDATGAQRHAFPTLLKDAEECVGRTTSSKSRVRTSSFSSQLCRNSAAGN